MAPKPKPAVRLQRLRGDGYKVRVTHLRLPVGGPVTITDVHEESFEVRSATLGAMRQHGIEPAPKGGETRVSILDGNDRLLAQGTSRCSDADTFSRRIGLAIALGRAEKTLNRSDSASEGEAV